MKSKFKDYLLYTLSTIGVVALFISATTLPPQTSTVPESHVWQGLSNSVGDAYLYNKITGEARWLHRAPKVNKGYIKLVPER
jgi:hypothetical protein